MFRKFASLIAAIAVSAAAVAPASSDTGAHSRSMAVAYADLDLTRVDGVKTLSIRLKKAIDAVCGRSHDSASVTRVRQIKACRAEAMSAAVAAIDAPLLTALYETGETREIAGL